MNWGGILDDFKKWWDDQMRISNLGYNAMPRADVHNAAQTAFIAGAKHAAARCMKLYAGHWSEEEAAKKIMEEFDL